MVVLYEHPLSPFAQKVKIALAEKGVAFESRLPDIIGGDLDEFARLNPRREVPTLVDDDVAVFDSTITKVSDGTLVKVYSWYDNEWGFSNRMLDTTLAFAAAK